MQSCWKSMRYVKKKAGKAAAEFFKYIKIRRRLTFPSSIFTIIVILGLVCPLLSPHASQECTFFTRKEIIHVFNVFYKMGQEYEENKANEVRFNNNLRNIYLKIIFFCSLPQLHDAYTAVCILQIGLANYMRMIMCRWKTKSHYLICVFVLLPFFFSTPPPISMRARARACVCVRIRSISTNRIGVTIRTNAWCPPPSAFLPLSIIVIEPRDVGSGVRQNTANARV